MKYGYRLATTEAGLSLGYLYALGLPQPTQSPYRAYTVKSSQSDGGEARHGFKNIRLVWGGLTPTQSFVLVDLVVLALATSGVIFATLDRSDGTKPGRDWIDVSGYPAIPDTNETPVNGFALAKLHSNVELVINNITIVNAPADFT